MKRIAVFPGSFDPITKGHESLVIRGLKLFDEIIIGIGQNTSKQSHFSLEQRISFVSQTFKSYPQIKVDVIEGLTIDFSKKHQANFILRGIRNTLDFEYEKAIAEANKMLMPEIETIFIVSDANLSTITSTIVREIHKNKGDISSFIPSGIIIE